MASRSRRSRIALRVISIGLLGSAAVAGVIATARHDRRAGPPVDPSEYTGDAACLSCHTGKASFATTAHHLSSRLPTAASIKGHFEPGRAVLNTPNPYLHFRMESRDSGFYQSAIVSSGPDSGTVTQRFGLVIGSGRKGQTYLFWRGDRLFQLPVSYWTSLDHWVMSPGYPEGVANFGREVAPRCLECHSTVAKSLPAMNAQNRYDTTSVILGIACERCHGPGKEHAASAGSPLRRILGGSIVQPAKLPRDRDVEICASCHGGIGEEISPAFSYRPGERLGNYLRLHEPLPDEPLDVHDNQVALLQRSACYRNSGMTCATCHDVHVQQRDPAYFSNRCLTCHTSQSCGLFPTHGEALVGRCVDCHMPEQSSSVIVSAVGGSMVRPQIRSHWIRVYPDTAGR